MKYFSTLCWDHQPCTPCDKIPLNMIASLKLLPIRWRYKRYCYAVSPATGICSRPGKEEKVVRLSFQFSLKNAYVISSLSYLHNPTLGCNSGNAKFEKLPLLDFGFLMMAMCCSNSPSPSNSKIFSGYFV